jgi:hypothetical protein
MNTGTILGSVTDPSGGAVPGAKIVITNLGTQISNRLETDTAGNYICPYLIPGNYEVTAEKEGFKKGTQTGITLQVDQKALVDLKLEVGAVTQSVTITGAAPMVNTETSEQGEVVTSQEIVGLPLDIRNFAQFVTLNAGAVPNYNTLGGTLNNPDNPQGIAAANVNGIDVSANQWLIDGVTDNETFFSVLSVNPSIDAIQEFKVSNNNFAAEYGNAGGANVQISMKSGTNSLHGGLFEFVRNSGLDANDFFSNSSLSPIPPFRQNQFGANVGGPIKKNRTFFFGDYEGFRQRLGTTELMTIPTMLQRQGIFTEPGSPTIYSPFNLNASGQPQPFPGNTIPSTVIDSPALKVMQLLPPPNVPISAIGQANYFGSNATSHDTDDFDVRIDHQISDKDQFFVRYSYLRTALDSPPFLGTTVGGDPYLAALANTRNQNGVVSEVHSFSSHTINEFRFGTDRVRTDWTAYDVNDDTSDAVGIPGINGYCGFCGGLARIVISGLNALGHTPYAPTFRHDTTFQWVDNATFIRGRHTIKAGGDVRRLRGDVFQTSNPVGEFDFDERFTSDLGASGTGLGVASFLLGYPEFAGRAAMTDYPSNRGSEFFFFGQDDFRVNDKLSLNYGLRYEYYTPQTDAHSNMSQFDLTRGDILLACIATSCSGGIQPDRHDWAPRLGFAYTPDHGKTAIRGSVGISYYEHYVGTLVDNYPFVNGQGLTPANTDTITSGDPQLSDGLPPPPPVEDRPGAPAGHLIASGGGASASSAGFSSIFYLDSTHKANRIYQWYFDVQRSITPNFTVDAAYVANSANHIGLQDYPANFPAPGLVTSTGLPLQELRPYYDVDPQLASFSMRMAPAVSHYESFQLKLERRFSHGLSLLASYTASKTLDRGIDFQDPSNYMDNKGLASFDTPQRLVVSYIYQLPFGRKKAFGKSWNWAEDAALGGWQVTGITTYQAGLPFSPSITSTLDNGNSNWPNRICNGKISNWTINAYYDWSCFVSPPANVFGNMGDNPLRGPGFRDWDVGLMKDFNFTESRYLQFRAEFFNLPNNENFGQPASSQCGGACGEGIITSNASGSNPREIQFALKFYF